jgi:hypothetical protein
MDKVIIYKTASSTHSTVKMAANTYLLREIHITTLTSCTADRRLARLVTGLIFNINMTEELSSLSIILTFVIRNTFFELANFINCYLQFLYGTIQHGLGNCRICPIGMWVHKNELLRLSHFAVSH